MFSLCFSDTLMLEPIILPDCGHTFCKTCISRVQQNPTTSHCPLCKKPMWSSTQRKTNFTLEKLVEKNEGSIEVVAQHTCPDAFISCSNRSCERSIKGKDEPTHKGEHLQQGNSSWEDLRKGRNPLPSKMQEASEKVSLWSQSVVHYHFKLNTKFSWRV